MTTNSHPASDRTPNSRRPNARFDIGRNSRSGNRNGRYTPPGLVQPTPPREPCRCPACAPPPPCNCWACEDERLGIPYDPERGWQRLTDIIEETGMAIQYVSGGPGQLSWAYTIGRLRRQRPELIAVGLAPGSVAQLFDEIEETWDQLTIPDDGICCVPGKPSHRFALMPVPDSLWFGDYLLGAFRDATEQNLLDSRAALQVLWPDNDGRFPWDPGSRPAFRRRQPILGLGD